MILLAINETNVFAIIKNFVLDEKFRKNFSLAESNVYIDLNLFQVIHRVLSAYTWNFDYSIIWGTNFFQLLIPCLAAIAGLLFYNDLNSIYKFSIYRTKNYKSFIIKEIFNKSIKLATSVFFAYLVFYIITFIVTGGSLNPTITRELLLDILGKDFYYSYTYLYYLLDGIVRFLIIPFIYSFFSCSISLIVKNQKQVLFAPNFYYFGLTLFAVFLGYLVGNSSIYFSPTTIMISGQYYNVNTLLLSLINLLPLLISFIILKRKFNNVEI
jgi:hypothetical protein